MPLFLGADSAAHPAALDLLIILSASAAVTMLFARLRMATIAAYLITGAVIGPKALGLVAESENVETISHLAIVLLLFLIGMHLDISSPKAGIFASLLVGGLSTAFSVLIGWPAAMLLGLDVPAALAVAMAASMSSTAVVMKTLSGRRALHQPHGRLCFGILLVQDLAAVLMLALMPLLAVWQSLGEGGGSAPTLASLPGAISRGLLAVGLVAGMLTAGRVWLPGLLRYAAGQSGEVLLVLSGAVALGAAAATSGLGFSPELGAFMAGLMLAATPFRFQLAGQLMPLRDLLIAVFFTVVGMKLDAALIVSEWWKFLIVLALVVPARLLAIGGTAWLAGATGPVAFMTGMALANGSEFGIVVLGAAVERGVIGEETQAWVLALLVSTLVTAPTLYELGHRLSPRLIGLPLFPGAKRTALRLAAVAAAGSTVVPEGGGHVIIAGYGVVGRALAERFQRQGLAFSIVELNPRTVQKQARLGVPVVYGDVTNAEVLESAGIHRAVAVALTIPDDDATLRACRVIRSLAPDVFIAIRTPYLSRAIQATQLGADHVTVEEMATAESMAREVAAKLRVRMSVTGEMRPAPAEAPGE